MALEASLAQPSDQCPDIVFEDTTDYSDAIATGTFKLHDYDSAGDPTANTDFTLSAIDVAGNDILGQSFTISTDNNSDIINPETVYANIRDQINNFQNTYTASLNKHFSTDYKDWTIDIQFFGTAHNGETVSATSTLTPVTTNLGNVVAIDARNMSLKKPDGSFADLGGATQVDILEAQNDEYNVGETVSIDFCGDTASYTVEQGEEDAVCVIQHLAEAVNNESDNHFDYVKASHKGAKLTLEAVRPGIPLQLSVSYTAPPVGQYFILSTDTGNQPSMSLPDLSGGDTLTYQPDEEGGEYEIFLTIVSGCNYTTTSRTFWNWCHDLQNLDCCIAEILLQDQGCDCKAYNRQIADATLVRNKIEAISIMKDKNYPGETIDRVVDSARAICKSKNCGC